MPQVVSGIESDGGADNQTIGAVDCGDEVRVKGPKSERVVVPGFGFEVDLASPILPENFFRTKDQGAIPDICAIEIGEMNKPCRRGLARAHDAASA